MTGEVSPNGWAAIIELIKTLSALGSAAIAAYLVLHTRKTNAKLDVQEQQNSRIEVLVNGNLHREQEENKRLRALLERNGIDHT